MNDSISIKRAPFVLAIILLFIGSSCGFAASESYDVLPTAPSITESTAVSQATPTIAPRPIETSDTPPTTLSESTLLPVIDAEFGMLLGGYSEGEWLDSIKVMDAISGSPQSYRLYGREGVRQEVMGDLPSLPQGPCQGQPFLPLSPNGDQLRGAIAVMGSWDAMPRQAVSLPVDTAVYQDVVYQFLLNEGVLEPVVQITAVDRVDLEGDGVDEVVIYAAHLTGLEQGLPTAQAGDYSVVLLRKIIDGDVQTMPLQLELFLQPAQEWVNPLEYTNIGYFDLNGNTQLEIVMQGWGYEKRVVQVLESHATGAHLVLEGGCGA